jgi:hypothetical protein
MPVHVRVNVGKPPREREHQHHDDSRGPPGWAKHREPKIEKPISSLTAGAGSDKWAQRAKQHSFGSDAARSPDEIADLIKRRRITR